MDSVESGLYEGASFAGAIGTYTLGAKIGDGNYAGVFGAVEDVTGRERAVKVLAVMNRPAGAVLEFQAETALLGLLTGCSNVITLVDSGVFQLRLKGLSGGGRTVPITADAPFMVLERAEGSLDSELADRHQISWERRLLFFSEVVKGIHQMHLKNMVHRDVKAENALVFRGIPCAKIADLGRSKDTKQGPRFPIDHYTPGKGDTRFAPPEFLWFLGTDDPLDQWRGDLYHLGSLLYELATATGITAVAVGDPLVIFRHAHSLGTLQGRLHDFHLRIPELRERYEPAYEAFRLEVPPAIRDEATALLRQLTDPDPLARIPLKPLGGLPIYWDLQWLLRRIEIMRKRLASDANAQAKRQLRQRRQLRRRVGDARP